MNLDIGSEKRFFDFISGLNEDDKIVLISHIDLDGIAAAKVVNKVVDADLIKILQYNDVDEKLAEKLKIDGYTKIIISDMYIEREEILKEIEKFAEVLILDHHPSRDWNSSRTVHLKVEEGYCAAYFCYKLFSQIQDIEKIDWLVAAACIADFCNVKNIDWIKQVFQKYNSKTGDFMDKIGFAQEDTQKSEIYRLQWEISLATIYFRENLNKVLESIGEDFGDIGDLGKYSSAVKEELALSLKHFEDTKKEFSDGYFCIFNFKFNVGAIISTTISTKYPDKTVMILSEKESGYSVSARRQDGKIDLGVFLKKLLEGLEGANGGGHPRAAGAYFMKKDLAEVIKRLGTKQ